LQAGRRTEEEKRIWWRVSSEVGGELEKEFSFVFLGLVSRVEEQC
jgi:hypothetical protein